ncbi:putative nucleotidyltransferase, ribonuclease H [Tanacetum coccineum]
MEKIAHQFTKTRKTPRTTYSSFLLGPSMEDYTNFGRENFDNGGDRERPYGWQNNEEKEGMSGPEIGMSICVLLNLRITTAGMLLRSCALEWTRNWDEYLCLVEFAYNNSWHASIKAAPYELLYGRKCRALICWNEVGERVIEGPKLIKVTNEKVIIAKEKLKEARS